MMTSKTVDPHTPSQRKRDQEIDGRYGAIGIAAVAAAMRYQSIGTPVAATSPRDTDERSERAA